MKTVIILSILLGVFFMGSIALGFMWSTVGNDLDEAKSELIIKNTTINRLQDQITSLQQENTSLEQENSTLQDSLDELNEVFPPKDFSSYTELINWLQSDDVSEGPVSTTPEEWYSNALKVQEHALNDGFIVSIDYDYYAEYNDIAVWCVTVINGYLFYWDPETDEVNEDFGLGAVR
jgi:predicted nuclease with TOPRIM domain